MNSDILVTEVSDMIILGALGWTEWILIALVVILLFGAKKIPELMKGLGGGMKEFKKAARDDDDETERPRPQVENREATSEKRENATHPPANEKNYSTGNK